MGTDEKLCPLKEQTGKGKLVFLEIALTVFNDTRILIAIIFFHWNLDPKIGSVIHEVNT